GHRPVSSLRRRIRSRSASQAKSRCTPNGRRCSSTGTQKSNEDDRHVSKGRTNMTEHDHQWWLSEDTSHFRPIFADVAEWAATVPDDTAMIFETRSWTYAELAAEVDAFARALLAGGITAGDRVA